MVGLGLLSREEEAREFELGLDLGPESVHRQESLAR
jgi:hypothetical protein